jgi:hypothetical protein
MSEIDDVLSRLMTMMMDVDTELSLFISTSPTPDDAADALVQLYSLKNAMADVYSTFSTKVIEVLQSAQVDELQIKGSLIEVRNGADRKAWEHQRLVSEVSRRLIESSIDMDTGERTMSTEEVITKILDFVQPSYWRVKELAKIGISADQYCEVGESKTNIIIRKAK